MPDFERLTDKLAVDVASSIDKKAWAKGYIAGKSRARFEVLAVVAVIYFGIALYGQLAGA